MTQIITSTPYIHYITTYHNLRIYSDHNATYLQYKSNNLNSVIRAVSPKRERKNQNYNNNNKTTIIITTQRLSAIIVSTTTITTPTILTITISLQDYKKQNNNSGHENN